VLQVVALIAGVALIRLFVADPTRVESASMEPSLSSGDVVLVVRAGATMGLDRGDVVTFTDPVDRRPSVKRVVGLAGDRVQILDAVLTVNGEAVDEPYADSAGVAGLYHGPVLVPDGEVFVLGDNRALSVDSREHGTLPLHEITGRVALRLWPLQG
jgi:signal peptidase I